MRISNVSFLSLSLSLPFIAFVLSFASPAAAVRTPSRNLLNHRTIGIENVNLEKKKKMMRKQVRRGEQQPPIAVEASYEAVPILEGRTNHKVRRFAVAARSDQLPEHDGKEGYSVAINDSVDPSLIASAVTAAQTAAAEATSSSTNITNGFSASDDKTDADPCDDEEQEEDEPCDDDEDEEEDEPCDDDEDSTDNDEDCDSDELTAANSTPGSSNSTVLTLAVDSASKTTTAVKAPAPSPETTVSPIHQNASSLTTAVTSASPVLSAPSGSPVAIAPKEGTSSNLSASSSTTELAAATDAGTQNINPEYQKDVLSALDVLNPAFKNASKTWTNVWGYQAAQVYQDLMDYQYWTKDGSVDAYAYSLLDIVTSQYNLNGVGATDQYWDDACWWMLAFLHGYRSYGFPELLNETVSRFNQLVASSQLSASDAGTTPNYGGIQRSTQIPTGCDVQGAVYWETTPDSSITAVATGLTAQVGAILYGITKQESFRQAADLALNFERRVLMDTSKGILNVDSITTATCHLNAGELSYNTGIYLDACTRLYQATGEDQYLDWATLTATTSISGIFGQEPNTIIVNQGGDPPDTFFNALTEYYVMIKGLNVSTGLQTQIKAFFKANRDNAVANTKSGDELYAGSILSLYMAGMIML